MYVNKDPIKNEIVPEMRIFLLKSIIVSVFVVRTKCLIHNKICIFIEGCRYTNMFIFHGGSNHEQNSNLPYVKILTSFLIRRCNFPLLRYLRPLV